MSRRHAFRWVPKVERLEDINAPDAILQSNLAVDSILDSTNRQPPAEFSWVDEQYREPAPFSP